jgi:F-type H+-transporting ATPase subunit b
MLNLLAQVVYLAAEEEPEGIDLIIPATEELIAGIIAFAIVFGLVLWLWPKRIRPALEARREAIAGQLSEAEEAKVEAQSLLDDYRQQLNEARSEANRIVEDARQQGESVRSEIVARAESEAEEITRRAREEAGAERERAAAALRGEVAELSLDLAQRVVSESVDREAQQALVDQFISDLDGMSE